MTMGLIVFACVFGGTLFGLYLSTKVAAHNLSADSKDATKMALGVERQRGPARSRHGDHVRLCAVCIGRNRSDLGARQVRTRA
jgi:hypothetical protein